MLSSIQAYCKEFIEARKEKLSRYTKGVVLSMANEEMKCQREDMDKLGNAPPDYSRQ